MSTLASSLATYFLNALWQTPLFLAAGFFLARLLRAQPSLWTHRLWVGILLLQTLSPGLALLPLPGPGLLLTLARPLFRPAVSRGAGHVWATQGSALAQPALHLSATLIGLLALVYLGVLLLSALRLTLGLRATLALRRQATALSPEGHVAVLWAKCQGRFHVPHATLAESSQIASPLTLGLVHKRVLLPTGLLGRLPPQDLETILAHECAHMHRNDFALHLLYEVLALPIAFHPAVWATRARLVESREWVCDALAAEAVTPLRYARSLLRLADLLLAAAPAKTSHAIGIFDANALERRLMILTRKTSSNTASLSTSRRFLGAAACALFALGACTSAWALRTGVLSPAPPQATPTEAQPVRIAGGVVAGTLLSRVNPEYPAEAKTAHIQGSVVLKAIISENGAIENLTVLSGPEELRASAVEAVRQWVYKPYLLNGNPTSVETTITVNYQLND